MSRVTLIAFLLLLAGCSTTQFLVANAPTLFDRIDRHANLSYGQDPRQGLDVYSPRHATNRPVVIFWYGGSWVKGKKSDYRFVGTTLAERGFVVVLPDYRLYPEVSFPAFDEDGARAVAWVEQHVQEFGGDPHHIVLQLKRWESMGVDTMNLILNVVECVPQAAVLEISRQGLRLGKDLRVGDTGVVVNQAGLLGPAPCRHLEVVENVGGGWVEMVQRVLRPEFEVLRRHTPTLRNGRKNAVPQAPKY